MLKFSVVWGYSVYSLKLDEENKSQQPGPAEDKNELIPGKVITCRNGKDTIDLY